MFVTLLEGERTRSDRMSAENILKILTSKIPDFRISFIYGGNCTSISAVRYLPWNAKKTVDGTSEEDLRDECEARELGLCC